MCVYYDMLFDIQYLPEDGIKIFANLLHTHLVGMGCYPQCAQLYSSIASILYVYLQVEV